MALINKLSAIGNAIREKTGKTDLLTLDQMPQEIKGIETGGSDSYYDTFWDDYQDNGTRTNLRYAFAGQGWSDERFKPKYDLRPINANNMFNSSLITDFTNLEVALDFSKCTDLRSCFQDCVAEHIGVIDMSCIKSAMVYYMFANNTKLKTIDKIIAPVKENKANFNDAFVGCSALENITIEGKIYMKLSFGGCSKLSNESVQSIIDALGDLTNTTAQTITFHATVKGNLTETQIASITSNNWTLA